MRSVRAIILYVLCVILLGALLASWLYWLVQWLAASFSWAEWMARHPFRRIFNRSLMIVALVGLWPLMRSLGIRSWAHLGYARLPSWWRQLLVGVLLGMVSVGVALVPGFVA